MDDQLSSTSRLEAFSDGVIAVIITIMVLELKVPAQRGVAGLLSVVPTLVVYFISFSFTAIYWINHHHLVQRIEQADQRVLYANLGFLFCLSLLPFFTSYVLEKESDSFSIALYAASMVVTGFSFLLLRLAIERRMRVAGTFHPLDAAIQRKHLLSLGFYGLAMPLAYYHPSLALADIALVTVIWIVPTAGTKTSEQDNR
ncbi:MULTISPECIES: TMEM175 family protein [Acidobacteriaceae]|uniref:TMEM175 family protein n=1 Tax=Acidobacteriaceae TaxID=204434 RepID=UPI00131E313E|nr:MULTISPECIES: TMEM175 family protein [Acidobacteriaceae]MDW5265915.1 TMEM175 family protein [Edaphobacter sp.]